MKKRKPQTYSLTPTDAAAVLAALPFISAFEADSEHQQKINDALAISVYQKITQGKNVSFTPQEFRIISCAVSAAKLYLSGQLRDSDLSFDLTSEEVSELRKHFFTYNRLEPILHAGLADS